MRTLLRCVGLGLLVPMLSACGSEETPPAVDDAQVRAVVAHHAALVHATYAEIAAATKELGGTVTALIRHPSEDTLASARDLWIAARELYGPSEVFRFRGGPIDAAETGVEGLINAWPMDEAYVDYVDGQPDAGLVNQVDAHPEITEELLLATHEQGGEENISTGWHAIEFLLWGQDLDAGGPGQRPASDYDPAGDRPHPARRATYLRLATRLLQRHLDGLVTAWAPDATDNHRHAFLNDVPPREALRRIVTGMGTLVVDELRGERLQVAVETRDPENEQSCFSDTTKADLLGNLAGVQLAWDGQREDLQGPGVRDLVQAVDPTLAASVDARLDAARKALQAIPLPFDTAIQRPDGHPDRALLTAAVASLDAVGDALTQVAARLDLQVNFSPEEDDA